MKKVLICVVAVFCIAVVLGLQAPAMVKVGDEIAERCESPHPYPGGRGLTMERVFSWPGAGYIAIHFADFDLAVGDYVEVSDPERQFVYTYEGKGKVVRGGKAVISQFWARHIPGEIAVVRLYSNNPYGGEGFVIDRWVRGMDVETIRMNLRLAGGDTEAICNADDKQWAKCYQGTTMYDESRAVCRLLINGSSACTGFLIGSEGHIMTNNHCISTQSEADNTDYEFMAEGATCQTSCTGWFACPGTVVATSGTMVKTDSNLDYTLVRLPTNVTGTYGYMQFRNSLPTVGERIYIPQHPGAKGKMLAVNSDADGGYCTVYSTNETPCMGGPGDIGYYADTEGGSSGSPVLAYSDNLIVALHHCANCPNRGVPVNAIITNLGSQLPANAIGGGTPPPQPPAAPTNLTATSTVKRKVTLRWTDNSTNETGFRIYRSTNGTSFSLRATVAANVTSYTDTATSRVKYWYKVCAYNTAGESCSGVVSVTVK